MNWLNDNWREFQLLAHFGEMVLNPVREELLTADQSLWERYTERQEYPGSAHHDTKAIHLRGPKEWTQEGVQFSLASVDYRVEQTYLPHTTRLMRSIFALLNTREQGRVMIVALKPFGSIDEHRDEGLYADHFSRVHLVLSAEAGKDNFYCGDSHRVFNEGQLFWFNHRLVHSASNLSRQPRVHLILDFKV